jgi:hypothetical protein
VFEEVNEPAHIAAITEKNAEAGKELRRVIRNGAGNTEQQG